jgi:hypothetical protein
MPDPTTLFLVRHGQTDWIARGIAGRLPDVHLFLRIEIRPASISSVRFYGDSLQILGVNDTGDLYA